MRTILCFGDSNTHGTLPLPDLEGSGRMAKHERWPSIMHSALGTHYDVIAEGHPGRTGTFDDPVEGEHKNGLRILPAILQSHKPLDLLIIMLGTNDLKARFNAPAIDIALGLARLGEANQTYGVGPDGQPPKLLYVAPVPIEEAGCLAEMFAGGASKSRALPGHLAWVAKQQGAAFLDLAQIARVDPLDGVHLTAEGAAAVGQAIALKVQEIFADE